MALIYLKLTSLWNLVLHRVGRLRQPKYLLGAVAACAYFYYFLGRNLGVIARAQHPAGSAAASASILIVTLVGTVLSALGLLRIAYAWAFPPRQAALRFSEAEIAFLFPAPVSRRTLLHFRILSSQIAIFFSAMLMAIVLGPLGVASASRILRSLGWWVILSTFDLHLTATNLTLSRLRQEGTKFNLWRIFAVSAIALYGVAVFWAGIGIVDDYASGDDFSAAGLTQLGDALNHAPLLHWLTLPFRIVLGPYLSQTPKAFLIALVPALAFLGLHYLWVVSIDADFHEGSMALAEKRAAAKAAAQGTATALPSTPKTAYRGPFPLGPSGPPEVAFLWKNLISLRSALFGRRGLMMLLILAMGTSSAIGPMLASHPGAGIKGTLVLVFCGIVAGYTVILGPQLARQDLRNDLPNMDILKTYPVEPWRLALGELLTPAAILTTILWITILVAVAAVDPTGIAEWLTPAVRVTTALCMALVAPLVCITQLIVPNLLMILMPGWYVATRTRSGGIEMFGQRIIFGFLQLFFTALVLVPSAGVAALVIFSSQWAIGVAGSVLLATVAILPILGGEAAVGLWFLGERVDGFDLSTESR